MEDRIDDRTYCVVLNGEEQYSIWVNDRSLPLGWRREGTVGSREQCLSRIEGAWKDMRPLSLQRRMAGTASSDRRADHE